MNHKQNLAANKPYKQLALNVKLRDEAIFANFYPQDNDILVSYLQSLPSLKPEPIYLWGIKNSGCSHLLQACCHAFDNKGLRVFFLSLKNPGLTPDILENIEEFPLVAIDDITTVLGKAKWEEALLHLYNRMCLKATQLLIAADIPASQLPISLPDLRSRLSSVMVFKVNSLTDDKKSLALQLHAKARGLNLNNGAAQFMLHHYSRDIDELLQLLALLDQASLTKKHKLTIQFIKEVLGDH